MMLLSFYTQMKDQTKYFVFLFLFFYENSCLDAHCCWKQEQNIEQRIDIKTILFQTQVGELIGDNDLYVLQPLLSVTLLYIF